MTHAKEPDKVTITGHYDDDGACRQIFVYLNGDTVTPAEVADAIRAVFRPDPQVTAGNGVGGATRAFPLIGVNGHAVNPGPAKVADEWFAK